MIGRGVRSIGKVQEEDDVGLGRGNGSASKIQEEDGVLDLLRQFTRGKTPSTTCTSRRHEARAGRASMPFVAAAWSDGMTISAAGLGFGIEETGVIGGEGVRDCGKRRR